MRLTRRALFTVGLTILSGLLLWPPIYAAISARRTAAYYRSNFQASRDMAVALHEGDWAILFGGRAGLGQLRALSQDPSLMPSGRRLASELHDYIDTGRHTSHIAFLFSLGDPLDRIRSPFTTEYWGYLYFFDSLTARRSSKSNDRQANFDVHIQRLKKSPANHTD